MSEETFNIESIESEDSDTILCVLFKNGKISASYYKINEKMLYVMNEIVDLHPEYVATKSLIREIKPLHIVTLGSLCDNFTKSLIDILTEQDLHTTVDSDQLRNVPKNMTLQSYQDYAFKNCEYRIKTLQLLSEPEGLSDEDRDLYLHSLINFQSKLSIYSLGVLIKFTEKSWTHIVRGNTDQLCFHHIKQTTMADHVFIDSNTFNALQVFHMMTHDANFKHGTTGSQREGLSLFRMFSRHCKSKLGALKLRKILLEPIKNLNELKKRLDFIEFTQNPKNQGFIETLQENIKKIVDVNIILGKIQHLRASRNDWDTLYKTLYHILFLNELSAPYINDSEVLMDLSKSVTANLYGLERCIDSALDFKSDIKSNRLVIKENLDADLDRSKAIREDIHKRVGAAAKIVIDQLPDYIDKCTVIYIPDMGHVVAIQKWAENCDYKELYEYGFQFMFELNDNFHYKNALCQDLDTKLGDIQNEILGHENRIIERVASFVIRYNNNIREPNQVIGLIDCLISMAKVAHEKGYVRPTYNNEGIHEIVNGRHPLLEILNSNYVKNDFYSGGQYSHIKIITGPNASGKSVYLKQTALIIFLAHVGSYLPVSKANISMIHSIHSRMHATESASLQLSAFMIDLTQMAQALYNANPSSLILMDEFGRGTTGHEGSALLLGALRTFAKQQSFCPHILVSTHFQMPSPYLDSPLISYQRMDHTRDPNTNMIIFLFKVTEGISTSYGLEIAQSVELEEEIINRARDFLEMGSIMPLNMSSRYNIVNSNEIDEDFLKDVNIPDI